MDEFDAPISKRPIEHCDISLDEVAKQACLLFDEFLRLDEPLIQLWDAPSSVSHSRALHEKPDSPINRDNFKVSGTRGLESEEGYEEDDENVPDCMALSRPQRVSIPGCPVESDEKDVRKTLQQQESIDKAKELASELVRAGDALVQQYEGRVKEVESSLLQLVTTEAANLTYERFSRAADDLIGRDKDWTQFMFAVQVGKRVCRHSKEAFLYSKSHFQQYVASFGPAMQQVGGVENFVKQGRSPLPQ